MFMLKFRCSIPSFKEIVIYTCPIRKLQQEVIVPKYTHTNLNLRKDGVLLSMGGDLTSTQASATSRISL